MVYKCNICGKKIKSNKILKKHMGTHKKIVKEIKLLESGFIPDVSKTGQPFKGKNKIIVS